MTYTQLLTTGIVFTVGLSLAFFTRWLCRKKLHFMTHEHSLIKSFLTNLAFISILILTLIITLTKLGVPTTSLIALLSAATLAVGLALKDFLANVAAGFMIVFLNPFKIGDFIRVGNEAGTVQNINLFTTRLATTGNEALFIPNRLIVNDKIVNKSYFEVRRLDITIAIAYKEDINVAKQTIHHVLSTIDHIQTEPAPMVAVDALATSSVNLLIRVWLPRQWLLKKKFEILEKVKLAFDTHQIEIPYPKLDVYTHHSAL